MDEMSVYYRWKSFIEDDDRPQKPRRFGVTEMRGPQYSLLSQNTLQDVFESMGHFVDGLKFSGGSHSLMPKSFVKEVIDMAHQHDVYVSTGDWAEHLIHKGHSAFKDYIEECKNLGFDTIELNVGSLGVPEETLLRYVRLIKSGGLKAKPQLAVKVNKSDIPVSGNRAYGAFVPPVPRNLELVEDVDFLIKRAERCLEAGADMIMIDADDVCKDTDSMKTDIIAKIIGRLGLEKTMFEASNARTSEWFIKQYGPKCKSVLSDVDDTITRSNRRNSYRRKSSCSECSTPLSNLRDGKHANKSPKEKQPCRSPISLRSGDLPNAMAHEENPGNSTSKLKSICCCSNICGEGGSTVVDSINPGTPGFGGNVLVSHDSRAVQNFPNRSGNSHFSGCGDNLMSSELRRLQELDSCSSSALICSKCGERFSQTAAAEAHHFSKHAVSELVEGNSSRRIVERICRTTWLESENNHISMETILKVCNTQEKIVMFEEYREIVKTKARQLRTRHARCRADGNELLRFFGTILVCSLGVNGSSAICLVHKCGVCQILRLGFTEHEFNGGVGIFTTSTCGRALDYIEFEGNENIQNCRKAVLVCRAIAGRVHKPLETFEESLRGFDSLAGKVGENSIIEDLYLLNPNAILPCFVVICA